jgi:hypothetical protein
MCWHRASLFFTLKMSRSNRVPPHHVGGHFTLLRVSPAANAREPGQIRKSELKD